MLAATHIQPGAWGQVLLPALAIAIGTIVAGGLIYIVRRIGHLFAEVEGIKHEMKPNGGTSMRDAVNRIDVSSKLLTQRVDDHIKGTEARLSAIEQGRRRWL